MSRQSGILSILKNPVNPVRFFLVLRVLFRRVAPSPRRLRLGRAVLPVVDSAESL